jgi:hypothetical protein
LQNIGRIGEHEETLQSPAGTEAEKETQEKKTLGTSTQGQRKDMEMETFLVTLERNGKMLSGNTSLPFPTKVTCNDTHTHRHEGWTSENGAKKKLTRE